MNGNAQGEDCKEGRLQVQLLSEKAGKCRKERQDTARSGPIKQTDNEGEVEEGEEGRESKELGTGVGKDGHVLCPLPELRGEGGGNVGAASCKAQHPLHRATVQKE